MITATHVITMEIISLPMTIFSYHEADPGNELFARFPCSHNLRGSDGMEQKGTDWDADFYYYNYYTAEE